jgi:hypothetical protein
MWELWCGVSLLGLLYLLAPKVDDEERPVDDFFSEILNGD